MTPDQTPREVTTIMTVTNNPSVDDTMPLPPVGPAGEGGAGTAPLLPDDGSDDTLFAGEEEAWPERPPPKGLHLRWPVAALLVVLIAGGGLWFGAYLQRQHGSSSTSSLASLFAGRSGSGRSGFSRFLGGGSSSGGPTTGTIAAIDGSTLYVTTTGGSVVTVKVDSTTTVDRNAKSSAAALQPGDTVTVEGTKHKGVVDASSVSATAAGVSSFSAGGFSFPGAGGGGG